MAVGSLPAVVDGIRLPETGRFPLLRGIEGAYRDAAFQGIKRFSARKSIFKYSEKIHPSLRK